MLSGIRFLPEYRYFFACVEAIDLFTFFCYNYTIYILSKIFSKNLKKTFDALDQFDSSNAIYRIGVKINGWR